MIMCNMVSVCGRVSVMLLGCDHPYVSFRGCSGVCGSGNIGDNVSGGPVYDLCVVHDFILFN